MRSTLKLTFVQSHLHCYITKQYLIVLQGHGRPSSHRPELVLNNFGTRLGRRVGRMLGSLFHQEPQFRGRRVATFHNQRDFIFFRWVLC
jgi:ribosome production factor 1